MTTSEYNKTFYPKYSNAECMLLGIENTLSKCKDPENVRYQFSCSGWSKESIAFLREAVAFYNESVKKEAIEETIRRKNVGKV